MKLPEGMFLFVPQKTSDLDQLRLGDHVREIKYRYKGKSYQKKWIGDSMGRITAIDNRHSSLLLSDMSRETSHQLYFGEEYIIDRMDWRQEIKFYFRGPKL